MPSAVDENRPGTSCNTSPSEDLGYQCWILLQNLGNRSHAMASLDQQTAGVATRTAELHRVSPSTCYFFLMLRIGAVPFRRAYSNLPMFRGPC